MMRPKLSLSEARPTQKIKKSRLPCALLPRIQICLYFTSPIFSVPVILVISLPPYFKGKPGSFIRLQSTLCRKQMPCHSAFHNSFHQMNARPIIICFVYLKYSHSIIAFLNRKLRRLHRMYAFPHCFILRVRICSSLISICCLLRMAPRRDVKLSLCAQCFSRVTHQRCQLTDAHTMHLPRRIRQPAWGFPSRISLIFFLSADVS